MPPDIEVEQDPAAVAAGKDPQLDRAIEVVLDGAGQEPAAQTAGPAAIPGPRPDSQPGRGRGAMNPITASRRGSHDPAHGHRSFHLPINLPAGAGGAGERYESKTRTFSQFSLFSSMNFR